MLFFLCSERPLKAFTLYITMHFELAYVVRLLNYDGPETLQAYLLPAP